MGATRTNIELDDDLIERAMAMYGTRTKKETVDLALRRLVGDRMTREEALAMRGVGYPLSNDELEAMDQVDLDAIRP